MKGRDSKPKPDHNRTGKRKCLRCGKGFDSYGPENRICNRCKLIVEHGYQDLPREFEGTA